MSSVAADRVNGGWVPRVAVKPELLFLSHRLPTPPHNGAAIRTFNTIRVLSESYRITALCFDRVDAVLKQMRLEERIDALRPYADVQVFPIPQQDSRSRFVIDHARSVVTNQAYTLYAYDSPEYSAAVRRARQERNFALVHVDTLDLATYLPLLSGLPIACTHHNVESQLLRRRAVTEPPIRRAYLNFQAAKLERLERYWLPRVAVNVAVSEDDAITFRKLDPTARVEVAPNGVDIDFFQPTTGLQDGCVFVGGTNWFPNRDGLEWFHAEILPELRALGDRSTTTWVGRCTEEDQKRFGGPGGVVLTDYVPDIRPYLQQAKVFIAPLRVGGGTRLKILDAWAAGKAVVSTARGCEGLKTVDGTNILIANDARDFAEAMIRVMDDETLRNSLGRAGRENVERHFSWDGIGRGLCKVYSDVQNPASISDRTRSHIA
jgi:glycosyltransferase involved in cell wall biosynthesis